MRKKRKVKRTDSSIFLIMIILIPILGSIMGYVVSKSIIIPYLFGEEKAVQESKAHPGQELSNNDEQQSKPVVAYQKMMDIQGISIYRIQVGAFSSADNARKLIKELESIGMKADLKKEGLYKVFVLYAFDKHLLEKHLPQIREKFKDAHISQASYPSVGIGYPESITKQVEVLQEGIDKCRRAIENIVDSVAAGEYVEDLVSQSRDEIESFKQQLNSLELSQSLEHYRPVLEAFYSDLLESYSEYLERSGDGKGLVIGLVNAYIDFIENISRIL